MQFSVEFDFVTVFDVFLSGYEKARKNGGSSYGERTVVISTPRDLLADKNYAFFFGK
jgi:hypothetical protein